MRSGLDGVIPVIADIMRIGARNASKSPMVFLWSGYFEDVVYAVMVCAAGCDVTDNPL